MNPFQHQGSSEVTALLAQWSAGDSEAFEQVLPILYTELHMIARRLFRLERLGHTLQPTALVSEAYLRLVEVSGVEWQGRQHFCGFAARVMRRILVDHSRSRGRLKRGGGQQRVELTSAELEQLAADARLQAIDDALTGLSAMDVRKAQIVELRYFGGFTVAEVARVLDLSPSTVQREWRRARAWLYSELDQAPEATGGR